MKPIRNLFFFSLCLTTHLCFSQVESPNVDPIIYSDYELMPEFPGGDEKMREYLEENRRKITNPRTQREYTTAEERMSERVMVRFIVDTNGSIKNVVLEVGLPHCDACNQEAIRLVENMPKWKPAEWEGKRTSTYVRLPIFFELEEIALLGCDLGLDPQFKGGEKKLAKYIQKNVKLIGNPKRKKSIPKEELLIGGRVVVLFIIESDGQVSHVELEEPLPHCEPCNQEALRLIENMPPWEPGRENGKAIQVCIRLPLTFEID
ncbi:MAG: hypothetical protein RLZZ30_1544 [Bacteroidota bacterium]|jgi:TonB family protein